jgi:hypothetical protein
MTLAVYVFDRACYLPGWALCITFGVLIAWFRWRSPWSR